MAEPAAITLAEPGAIGIAEPHPITLAEPTAISFAEPASDQIARTVTIARGGPVTVIHADMKRYFMTIPEASQLVLQAAAIGKGGEVFILDMGEPVSVLALAQDLVRLSGLEPGRDVEIKFTGIRPGEKLFEELATDEERAEKTSHNKVFVGRVRGALGWAELGRGIEELLGAVDGADERAVYEGLRRLIPEFTGKGQLEKMALGARRADSSSAGD